MTEGRNPAQMFAANQIHAIDCYLIMITLGLDVSADCLLAQEIEKQEHEARKMREQKEFELLKVSFWPIHSNFDVIECLLS